LVGIREHAVPWINLSQPKGYVMDRVISAGSTFLDVFPGQITEVVPFYSNRSVQVADILFWGPHVRTDKELNILQKVLKDWEHEFLELMENNKTVFLWFSNTDKYEWWHGPPDFYQCDYLSLLEALPFALPDFEKKVEPRFSSRTRRLYFQNTGRSHSSTQSLRPLCLDNQ